MSLSSRLRFTAAALPVLFMLVRLSGCVLPTRDISSADPPDEVLDGFISALKEKNHPKADGAYVSPVNESGDGQWKIVGTDDLISAIFGGV